MPISIQTTKQVTPQCYAYTLPGVPDHDGWTKIGFTERDVEMRVKEQTHTAGIEPKIWWYRKATYLSEPYGTFDDKHFHAYLKKLGIPRKKGTEWFNIAPDNAKSRFLEYADNHGIITGMGASDDGKDAVIPYTLREEQAAAVDKTLAYFEAHENGEFLWNAKPRFGKTLSAYDLCMKLGAMNILIVTNRPAIANSWYQDYETFFGPSSGYAFVSSVDGLKGRKYVLSRDEFRARRDDNTKGCIEFVSLQDLKGSIYFGGQYDKLAELDAEKGLEWDILIIDEAHEGVDTYKTDTAFMHINRKHTLHLSGTPFKALANDKFEADAIYNWTYADEQERKRDWDNGSETENPYAPLPTLNLYTYQMSDIIRDKVRKGIQLSDNEVEEFAFDLSEFFATNESGKFIHDNEVDKFLDVLTVGEKFPFSTEELRNEIKHSFWMLNRVASAKALAKKLHDHPVFRDYFVVLAAGDGKLDDDDESQKAYDKVVEAIKKYDKTITLSVGQLTTGVTIPEWTAVLMLSNMESPALYMQAAFRAQNPCLFTDGAGNSWRKENAYVFDFDPARTLTIFERFANDLIPDTAGDKGTFDDRRNNVRELLNFFPVYGEDDGGEMVMLDAEAVLTIPRHIHAKEVVERGFMSNFLFANISGIFNAPQYVIDTLSGLQAQEEPKKLSPVDITETTAEELSLNADGGVELSKEQVIGLEKEIFGEKIYGVMEEAIEEAAETARAEFDKKSGRDELDRLQKIFAKPAAESFMDIAKDHYGQDIRRSNEARLERQIQEETNRVVSREYGDYTIQKNKLENEHKEAVRKAQEERAPMAEITRINAEYEEKQKQNHEDMIERVEKKLQGSELVEKVSGGIVDTVEHEKREAKKNAIEDDIRDHLRGFSRTIPAFLMAYGDENTTLANFDKMVPSEVFWEVTVNPQTGVGVSMEMFKFMRDGGDYTEKDENGNDVQKYFAGHLFDEVVFNDAVQEFLRKKKELADYFDPKNTEDIFNYIPPQRTNQIFSPKQIVMDMVSMMEKENPGCFDQEDKTFADLYMKSGMYITEIVKRLFNSPRLKILFPDEKERLNHIFAKQVYGLAPTEIIYRICLSYILGFSDEIGIEKHNIVLCDALDYAKKGTLQMKLEEMFPELKEE